MQMSHAYTGGMESCMQCSCTTSKGLLVSVQEILPHHVYVCSKVNVSSVDTMCSSCPSKTVRLTSEPAAVTMHDLTPNAVATAAAYEIAPPCSHVSIRCLGGNRISCDSTVLLVHAYQCLFLVNNIDCQVAHKQHWGPAVQGDLALVTFFEVHSG